MLEQNPDDAEAHFWLGTVYWIQQHSRLSRELYREFDKKAQDEFLRAVELQRDHCDARWYLALMYDRGRGRQLQTKKMLEEIVAINPSYRCKDELFFAQFSEYNKDYRADLWLEWIKKKNK